MSSLVRRTLVRALCVSFVACLFAFGLWTARGRAAATITVNTLTDGTSANDGKCTLREAITNANADNQSGSTDCAAGSGADTIQFSVAGTINLSGKLPDVTTSMTIQGPGADKLTVRRDTGGSYRIFTIYGGPIYVYLSGLTIANGQVNDDQNQGGGIFNGTTFLTITACAIKDNHALYFADGDQAGAGGGIYNIGWLYLRNSTVSGNSATGDGAYGGGMASDGAQVEVTNCTFSGNSAPQGGGILVFSAQTFNVTSSTFASNTGEYGADINCLRDLVTLRNTILADTIRGSFLSEGFNLVRYFSNSFATKPTDITGQDPLLGPLQNNGGTTQTHALQAGSPAIDKGDDNSAGATADQRGQTRPYDFASVANASGGDGSDIGAFELQPAPTVTSIDDGDADDSVVVGTTLNYNVTFSQDMDDTTVTAADFDNAGTASVTVGSVSETSPGVFAVQVTANTAGTLQLRIPSGAVVKDASGNQLVTPVTDDTTVAVVLPALRVNNSTAQEPTAGAAAMLFVVTLSPAPASAVTVQYATAPGGPTPASGGAACGGPTDYESKAGTLTFNAGEQVKTFTVNACADSSSPEPAETFLVNLSNASGAAVAQGQATGTITQGNPPGTLVISELRTSGPGGPLDDFVELYNNTDNPLTVQQGGYGLFKMGATCAAAPVLVGTVPAGAVIPARGHYLLVGSAYSLKDQGGTDEARGDGAGLTADIENDRNVGLFSTTQLANLSTETRLDAVGFGSNTGQVCDLLREGSTLPAMSGSTLEYTFFRDECGKSGSITAFGPCPSGGYHTDLNSNSTDFVFADTTGSPTTAGQRLGTPGPQNLASPVVNNATVPALSLDQSQCSTCAPNRTRTMGNDGTNNNGVISVRKRVWNNTGAPITKLRFRIIDITTKLAPGTADVRARTSANLNNVQVFGDPETCGNVSGSCLVTVLGTSIGATPGQPEGGGFNATWTVTLGTPLQPGKSVLVQIALGVMQGGSFRFNFNTEAGQ